MGPVVKRNPRADISAIQRQEPRERPVRSTDAASQIVDKTGLMDSRILRAGIPIDKDWVDLADKVVLARPPANRQFDQIYMMSGAMIFQTILMHDHVAGRDIVFMGDGDGMSMMFGLFAVNGVTPKPRSMLVLDMDKRVLAHVRAFAKAEGFADLIETRPYNVFDPVPVDLRGQGDMFYTNPPYGSKNSGTSGVLFLARCMELTKSEGSFGVVILPYSAEHPWSLACMARIQQFVVTHGYVVSEMVTALHRYHLPDNPVLSSGYLILDRVCHKAHPWAGAPAPEELLNNFYGTMRAALPQSVEEDGSVVLRECHAAQHA